MDLEAFFRDMIRLNVPFKAQIGLNGEGRVLLRIESDPASAGFVIVENTAVPADIAAPAKPPTQSVSAAGFDAHKGMGERA